jgi:drug/metabolite transporter (DMT)-like permease
LKINNSKLLVVLAFFAIYVIWGSTYLFNKIAVTELPPFFLASIRFISAGVLIMIIAKCLKFKRINQYFRGALTIRQII